MSNTMLHPHTNAVKAGRFVPATVDGQAEFERQIGRNLYRRGKPVEACVTDDMTAGYLAEEAKGADAYWRAMMAEAVN